MFLQPAGGLFGGAVGRQSIEEQAVIRCGRKGGGRNDGHRSAGHCADALPDFSGYIKYKGEFDADGGNAILDLGCVGQTAHLYLNGEDMGVRVTAPYAWDLSGKLKKGVNQIEITGRCGGSFH